MKESGRKRDGMLHEVNSQSEMVPQKDVVTMEKLLIRNLH